MPTGYDIAEAFRTAWGLSSGKEYGYLGTLTVPGLDIRRFATAFAGRTAWKCVDVMASDNQLYLLGLDIARFHFRGAATNDLYSLDMGRFDRDDITKLGRIAHNAVYGPKHPVIKAIFRRFKA